MRTDAHKYAHDLNGVLGAILTNADLQVMRDGDTATARQAFERIRASAQRGGDLVQKLLDAATHIEGGLDATHERDLDYLTRIHPPVSAALADLEKRGLEDDIPIVDRETGRLLAVMARSLQAANILEIGTAYGYSTLWFACAQPQTGRVVTIDPDRGRTEIAAQFWRQAGVAERIEVINEPALQVLPRLPKQHYDIIFIDALKEEYVQYLEACLPLLKKHGLMTADNLLWHHAASETPRAADADSTKAIRHFNEVFLHHPELNATIIPVGDGLGIGAKLEKEKLKT